MDKIYTVRTCEMMVITGIPGAGKSTWLDALTTNMNRYHSLKFVKDCGIYKELGEMDMEEVKRRSKEKDIAPF